LLRQRRSQFGIVDYRLTKSTELTELVYPSS
jgi:hypothetical protein